MDKDEAHKQEPVRAWFTVDEFVEMAERRTKEWAKQADIPDLIAGALGVSRGTAYDLMRDALKEAAPVQEPVATVIEELEHDGEGFCAKVRWLYNPVPVGETLSWEQPK